MISLLPTIALASLFAWLVILLLPWQPWRNREILEKQVVLTDEQHDLDDISVVIPARNEAVIIGETLAALVSQGKNLKVMLVDDCSNDDTAEIASQFHDLSMTIVRGVPTPDGWTGKLWALEQGIRRVKTTYTLLLDADIRLAPGIISALKKLSVTQARPFVSVMACLPMGGFWEKLLTPAFIYFFKMLYPFSLANSQWRAFASAAGGCIFMETRLFASIDGLESIRDALIDDCTLAWRIKQAGFRTWTGQSRRVVCVRPYAGLGELWNMVARSAYTQLGYSVLILLLCTSVMILLFVVPPMALITTDMTARYIGSAAWVLMALTYLPTLLFYARNPLWSLAMPMIGALYLAMTWTSAIRYWEGERSRWKERKYVRSRH
jgi:hopene-associated glycosyltransferase HpnB